MNPQKILINTFTFGDCLQSLMCSMRQRWWWWCLMSTRVEIAQIGLFKEVGESRVKVEWKWERSSNAGDAASSVDSSRYGWKPLASLGPSYCSLLRLCQLAPGEAGRGCWGCAWARARQLAQAQAATLQQARARPQADGKTHPQPRACAQPPGCSDCKQARKSLEDTQVAGYTGFGKV